MVSLNSVNEKNDILELKQLIEEHVSATGSAKGREILGNFEMYLPKFKKILPFDYARMMTIITQMEEKGLNSQQAQIEAFYANVRK